MRQTEAYVCLLLCILKNILLPLNSRCVRSASCAGSGIQCLRESIPPVLLITPDQGSARSALTRTSDFAVLVVISSSKDIIKRKSWKEDKIELIFFHILNDNILIKIAESLK